MMGTAGYISYIICDMKYSLYRIVVRGIFYNDYRGALWLWNHVHYFWYNVLLVAIIVTSLTLIGQFMDNNIFTKPSTIFVSALILWVSWFFVIKSHKKILDKNDK